MKYVQFNHVIIESTHVQIPLNKKNMEELERQGLDVNDKYHTQEIANHLASFALSEWEESYSSIVTGEYTNPLIVNE
jgi:hypothetical protein